MGPKGILRKSRDFALAVVGVAASLYLLWAAVNVLGQSFEPKIRGHEQEHAYCYTASKMFFVSIACVPKN